MDNQIRTEISQLIQKLPENQLESILEYLRQLEKTSAEQVETANFVKKIFEEDAELLKRLAR